MKQYVEKCNGCLSPLCIRCPHYHKRIIVQELRAGATFIDPAILKKEFSPDEIREIEYIMSDNAGRAQNV